MKLSDTCRVAHVALGVLCLTQASFGAPELKPRVELRGVFSYDSYLSFSLHFPESNQSAWLQLNDERHGVRLTRFDSTSHELTVLMRGQAYTLALKTPDGIPLSVIYEESSSTATEDLGGVHDPDYHDQQYNPVAAQLVLEAVRRRAAEKHADTNHPPLIHQTGGTGTTSGSRAGTEALAGAATDGLATSPSQENNLAPIVRRNRVYNFDYAIKR